VPHSVPSTLEGGTGSDKLVGGPANDVLYAGEDSDPDTLEGGGGNDVLYGVNIFHPKKDSGAATMNGGDGSDLMIGGQPCDGDTFDGGPGANDSASFARVHNSGVAVEATIGGEVTDPDAGGGCNPGQIDSSTEKIEGSPATTSSPATTARTRCSAAAATTSWTAKAASTTATAAAATTPPSTARKKPRSPDPSRWLFLMASTAP